MTAGKLLETGGAALGIELGSTRIKAVAIDEDFRPIATGSFDWENRLENGIWTYGFDEILNGVRACYADLKRDALSRHKAVLHSFRAIGISGMMHGYLALDRDSKPLAPFRTWRNTNTQKASDELGSLFSYPVPERWSVSHLYQSILEGQPHLRELRHLTTLSGYVHRLLTGMDVLGIGDASGMFPVDDAALAYDKRMMGLFDDLTAPRNLPWRLGDLLPRILVAGESAGKLTKEGALLLDPSGDLEAGIPLCPPEGDAGTGMVATNSVRKRTGNVSAGTSVFLMAVLERKLKGFYPKLIDLVSTPDGSPVAMSHANNCTGDYDAWLRLFGETLGAFGVDVPKARLYDTLLSKALEGDKDCGGLMVYNYISGETMTSVYEGRPLFMRKPGSAFTLANFMRASLFSSLATMRIGMDILFEKENVALDRLTGHGGFFKTAKVGQTMMSAALGVPVSVTETSGEGGPWGMALLASFMTESFGLSLPEFLDAKVFSNCASSTIDADEEDKEGFGKFYQAYKASLETERTAAKLFS